MPPIAQRVTANVYPSVFHIATAPIDQLGNQEPEDFPGFGHDENSFPDNQIIEKALRHRKTFFASSNPEEIMGQAGAEIAQLGPGEEGYATPPNVTNPTHDS